VTLNVITATIGHERTEECVRSWGAGQECALTFDGSPGMLQTYQHAYEHTDHDILCYLHDDLLIREEGWRDRVLTEFEDPKVGVVGFGGALVHGSSDLYKRPYQLQQLGRSYYLSNVDDAEVHGDRFDGACDVAVLDGYALCVRRDLLDRVGGWPVGSPIGYSLYDYWLCCVAHRHSCRVRLVGVRSHHYGGMTAIGKGLAKGEGDAHERAHEYIYQQFSDVLPWTIGGDQ